MRKRETRAPERTHHDIAGVITCTSDVLAILSLIMFNIFLFVNAGSKPSATDTCLYFALLFILIGRLSSEISSRASAKRNSH